ncbi:PaaI family thioesterase [Duganella sp. LX20W]|uniref:PaaI family thioesterase n=1 Tax=Rugamonas brunnea TaxID=2758569 RepID=A0A7W2EWS7_9BURK|nr:PaaI family thioesterase [Rugamonas brunnea]MBA5640054.1 PaaI family thioesterase [Rugamonas brunnea]
MTVDQVIAGWKADEAAVRARLREPQAVPRERLAGRSGMEVFQAIFAGELPPAPIGDTLDFVPIHMAPGAAVFQGRPQRRHYNPLGTVHGGWFATLLDSAVGCAIHTTLAAGKGYTTLELKVNMVRALDDSVPLVRAEGKVIHVGRQVATAEGRIVGADGKLYAHATTTCLIFDHPAASARYAHERA